MRAPAEVKRAARTALQRAVERGEVVRPDACVSCGAVAPLQGHHDDYTKALDVRWLCVPCHTEVHNAAGWDRRSWTKRSPTELGARVRAERERLGLSVAQLRERAGLPRLATVYELETRESDPRLSTVVAVARALGVSVDSLLPEVAS